MAKKKQHDYDLVIIGSGAAGSVAAHIGTKAGLSVAIIEADLIGGECPNIGCVPTKALLQAAEIYEAAKHGSRFGIRGSTVGYNYPSIKAWKDLAVKRTGTYLGEEMYTREGISVIKGHAHFVDSNTVSVGVARISADHFLIATGSELSIPPIAGLQQSGYITYREAINLTRPPRSLAIVGGGAIGCEFATIFAIFGTKVHIIDIAENLLAKEEPEAGQLIAERFTEEYSMSVHLGTVVDKVEKAGGKKKLTLRSGKKSSSISVDEILMATGKRGVVDIGLENAGVVYEKTHIPVNPHMQTSAPHIFAAGDCVGPYLFTHMSTYQSKIAIHNILHPRKKITADYSAVPRCIFTNPEVASVGKTESELKAEGARFKKAMVPVSVIGRANTSDVRDGFVKVLADTKTNVLLGGTVVSPHAGEVIHELTLAIQNKLTAKQVSDTIHAFPTWSEALRVACAKLTRV
jgi:pyruvate/2-oxoglutarate dehydrogenase complex dihydrolipoamide dehydrogenase (E3) component